MLTTCPCGREVSLDDRFAGLKVRCPFCRQVFEAPVPTAGAANPDDPDVIDLEPADRPEPPPRRSRPRSRAGDADAREIAEIRRKVVRPFSWSRPATWSTRIIFDIGAVVMLCFTAFTALLLGALAFQTPPTDAAPQRITLEQLLRNGPGDNNNVIITDFVPSPRYVFLYSKNKHEVITQQQAENRYWKEVWVPLVPLTAEMKGRLARGDDLAEEFEPAKVRAVVRLSNLHDKVSAAQ